MGLPSDDRLKELINEVIVSLASHTFVAQADVIPAVQ